MTGRSPPPLHLPMQKRPNKASSMSSTPARPVTRSERGPRLAQRFGGDQRVVRLRPRASRARLAERRAMAGVDRDVALGRQQRPRPLAEQVDQGVEPPPVFADTATSARGSGGPRSALAWTRIVRARSGPVSGSPSHRIRSAAASDARARATPIASIESSLSRRPAVSTSRKGAPPIAVGASTRSRVVPAISEVIAASRPANALRRLDFPAFGGPR